MAQVKILPPPKRTDEESIAFRATVSPPHLGRILPKPALPPLPGPNPIQVLRELMEYPFPEPVWAREAATVLRDGEPDKIAQAIKTLEWVKAQHQAGQAKLHKAYPLLYAKSA